MAATAHLANRLVQAAMRLHRKALWNEFEEDDALAFEIPGHDRPLVGCICGQSGEEHGLILFRDGLPGMEAALMSRHPEDYIGSADQLSLLVSPLREIPPGLRGLLEEARWRGRRDALAPHVIVLRPGKRPRGPRKGEIRTMLYATSALLGAHDAGLLEACPYDAPEGVPLLRLSGKPHAPEYEIGRLLPEPGSAAPRRDALRLSAATHKRVDATWSVGLFTLSATIRDDERSVRVLLLADRESGLVLANDVFLGEGIDEAAEAVLRFADGEGKGKTPQLPREIRCLNHALRERLHVAFEEAGVACVHDPHQPELERIAAAICGEPEAPYEDEPAAAWRDAVGELLQEFAATAKTRRLNIERAAARYFGVGQRAREVLGTETEDLVHACFMFWMFLQYRARRDSKTILEKTLQRRLPARMREVAQSMRDARPSLYRIERANGPELTLLDLASGERKRARDRGLASSAPPGTLLSAMLYAAGPFSFVALLGPPVPAGWATGACDHLEALGIEITPAGLSSNPHFGGLLVEWMDGQREVPREIRNSDGEELLLHTADFEMADPPAALASLDARDDIDFDEPNGSYVWFRDQPDHATRPGMLLLGRLEVLDDHLVLECNSKERFEQGRAFLEEIAGISFTGVRTSKIDLTGGELIPADDLPGIDEQSEPKELPPEVVEGVMAVNREMQFKWLDLAIPAFGGRTPREVCTTPEGRRRVRLWIRTMPNPSPSISDEAFDALRDDLVSELQL